MNISLGDVTKMPGIVCVGVRGMRATPGRTVSNPPNWFRDEPRNPTNPPNWFRI
jgi:hypothetical protein